METEERLLLADAVVFDVGNVLLSFEPEQVAQLLPAEHRLQLKNAMFGPELRWSAFDLGRRSNEENAALIAEAARVPDGARMILRALYHFPEGMTPLPLYYRIQDLKERGKRVYLLTNYAEPSFSLTCELFPELKRADGEVVSAREKCTKPDPEIYRRLIRRYELDPARSLYIDDAEANIRAGAQAGFQVWHYGNR